MTHQQICDKCGLPVATSPNLETMFEEDFERCFICQQPCKGLYCSSECRQRDQGTPSPAIQNGFAPVKITSQLPPSLSPLVRPTYPVGPSPRQNPATRAISNGFSSGSSSASSSPLQSPQTNPSDADSPKKDIFNLPPPAYPSHQLAALPGSVPVKIPALVPRPSVPVSTQHIGSHGSTIYPGSASIDTLRFGRKPGALNSVTSPNALLPRCACGKAANHRSRGTSKERAEMDSGFSRLSLDPTETIARSFRVVSESSGSPFTAPIKMKAASGDVSPAVPTLGSASLLSRSRSDPIHPDPQSLRRGVIAPHAIASNDAAANVISPSLRHSDRGAISPSASRPTRRSPVGLDVNLGEGAGRRGRSRERQEHHIGQMTPNGILNHPADREQAPSRSRHRREEREREGKRTREVEQTQTREREREMIASPRSPNLNPQTQIMPSWSRRASASESRGNGNGNGEGVVSPLMRRTISGEKKRSPVYDARVRVDDEEKERKQRDLKRATEQLQVFGVAAG